MDTTQQTIGVLAARCLFLISIALGIAGCETNQVVSTSDRAANGVASRGIDITDFKRSAAKLVDDLNAKGVLNRYQGRQPIIGVSTVINNTAERIDPAMLTDVLMSSLSDDARVMINRGMGADGKARYEDYMGAAKAQEDRFREDAQQAPRPDLTLSGEIKSAYSRDNKARLHTYTIYLRLTDGEKVVWQGYNDFRKVTDGGGAFWQGQTARTGSVLPKVFHPAPRPRPRQIIGYVDKIMSESLVQVTLGSTNGMSVGDTLEVVEQVKFDGKGISNEKEERVIAELELLEVRESNSDARHSGSKDIQLRARVRPKVASSTMR